MHVKKGKSIGAQKGLVDELNAILNWYHTRREGKGFEFDTSDFNSTMYNVLIEPGPGITVTCGGNGQPYIISTTGGSGGGSGNGTNLTFVGTDGSTATIGDESLASKVYLSSTESCDISVTVSQCDDGVNLLIDDLSSIRGLKFVGTDGNDTVLGEEEGALTLSCVNDNPNVPLSVVFENALSDDNTQVNLHINVPQTQTAWMWRPTNRTFANCYYQYGRHIEGINVGTNLADGAWYLVVDNASGNASLTQTPISTVDYALSSCFYIATISNNKMTSGICSTPVVCVYEN